MATRELDAAVGACHWGFYDAALPPVLTIASGDTLIVGTGGLFGPAGARGSAPSSDRFGLTPFSDRFGSAPLSDRPMG